MALRLTPFHTLLSLSLSVALCAPTVLYSPSAFALGLGTAEIKTIIGQPLLTEIPILDDKSSITADEIKVRQITGRKAEQLGFDLAADAHRFNLLIIEKNQRLVLQVRSSQPMNEPFVSILVELSWAGGSLYRGYDLLLELARPSISLPQSGVESETPTTRIVSSSKPNSTIEQNRSIAGVDQWRVGPGDSLSQIAQRIRPDENIKLAAVIAAIYAQNKHAFLGEDINQLQAGSLLNLPRAEDFATMPLWDDAQPAATSKTGTSTLPTDSEPPANKATPPAGHNAFATSATEHYTVRSGDTLSEVAQRLRTNPDESLSDVIARLFRLNPEAFENGNINRLRIGAHLTLPESLMATPEQTLPSTTIAADPKAAASPTTIPDTEPALQPRFRLSGNPEDAVDSSPVAQINRQIDTVKEQLDYVNRENDRIRQRIEKIEGSEHLQLLEEMLQLQEQRITLLEKRLQQGSDYPQPKNQIVIESAVPIQRVSPAQESTDSNAVVVKDSSEGWIWLLLITITGVMIALFFIVREKVFTGRDGRNSLVTAAPGSPKDVIDFDPATTWGNGTAPVPPPNENIAFDETLPKEDAAETIHEVTYNQKLPLAETTPAEPAAFQPPSSISPPLLQVETSENTTDDNYSKKVDTEEELTDFFDALELDDQFGKDMGEIWSQIDQEQTEDNTINLSDLDDPESTASTNSRKDSSLPSAHLDEVKGVISEAMIYAAYGRKEEAIAMLEQQLTLTPEADDVIDALKNIQKGNN